MHRDRTQEDPREVEAAKYDLNYIGLTGTYCTVRVYILPLLPQLECFGAASN